MTNYLSVKKTNFFGFYQFETISVGQTYIVGVQTKLAQFEPQIVSVNGEINDLNFAAQ